MYLWLYLFVSLRLVLTVSAHGFVWKVNIDGKSYDGNQPNGRSDPSIIRQIDDTGPVKGAGNPDINCGINSKRAQLVADASPGSVITFDWRAGSDMSKVSCRPSLSNVP